MYVYNRERDTPKWRTGGEGSSPETINEIHKHRGLASWACSYLTQGPALIWSIVQSSAVTVLQFFVTLEPGTCIFFLPRALWIHSQFWVQVYCQLPVSSSSESRSLNWIDLIAEILLDAFSGKLDCSCLAYHKSQGSQLTSKPTVGQQGVGEGLTRGRRGPLPSESVPAWPRKTIWFSQLLEENTESPLCWLPHLWPLFPLSGWLIILRMGRAYLSNPFSLQGMSWPQIAGVSDSPPGEGLSTVRRGTAISSAISFD